MIVSRAIGDVVFPFIYSFVETKKVPSVTNPLLKESAVSLAEKIRTQKVTAEEVVRAFIDRVKEVNPFVNMLVDDRFGKALEEAKQVDRLIRSGSTTPEQLKREKPLLGVPFTAKEELACEGLSWTRGLIARKGKKAAEDAVIVQGLKNSGAILIGVTNIPEFCAWVETRNLVFGQTNNPFDTNRTAGGSSGGEACIVSCCGSPIGLGSDLGGSIRIPAFYCGVYGHKLSSDLINTKGMLYRDGTEKGFTMLTSGTLTKYAADLKPSSTAIVLPEKLHLLQLDEKVDARKLKYHYVLDPRINRVGRIDREIIDGIKKLVTIIGENNDAGNTPLNISIPGLKKCDQLMLYWIHNEEIDLERLITDNQGRASLWKELFKKLFGQSNYALATLLTMLNLKFIPPSSSWAESETKKLRNQIMQYLENDGILLFPSCPTTAPFHYQPLTRVFDLTVYAIFNFLHLPVTQVPIGVGKDGLPFGIQVVAAPNQDRLCFAVAEYIESLIGGWIPPFSS